MAEIPKTDKIFFKQYVFFLLFDAKLLSCRREKEIDDLIIMTKLKIPIILSESHLASHNFQLIFQFKILSTGH